MPFELRSAALNDIPGMRKVFYSAFGHDVIGSRVFLSDLEASDRFWETTFSKELVDPKCQLLVVTHKASSTSEREEIVAFAKWCLPGAAIDDPPPANAWPANGDLAVEFFGTMAKAHRRIMGNRQHYYLEALGTHADWQGNGAAGSLLRWGLERADADGLPCFLESTAKGKPIYEAFGFQAKGEHVFDWSQDKMVETFMERGAKI